MNVLCSQYALTPSGPDIIVCGGADKVLRGYDSTSSRLIFFMSLQAPVLSIRCHSTRIAAAMMDGTIVVVSTQHFYQRGLHNIPS